MNASELEQNKQLYLDTCRREIHRDGLERLLDYLEKSDFFTAPSSSNFHLNEAGGLCRHSLNVFEAACNIYDHIYLPQIKAGNSPFTHEISRESIAIATLFHDLCKINFYHETQRFKKDETGRWVTYPGYEVKDSFPFGHGEKSCLMVSWYMRLEPEELLAIRWHMGMFDMAGNGSSMSFSFRAAVDKSPLVSIVHSADFLVSNLVEKTTEH